MDPDLRDCISSEAAGNQSKSGGRVGSGGRAYMKHDQLCMTCVSKSVPRLCISDAFLFHVPLPVLIAESEQGDKSAITHRRPCRGALQGALQC